MPSVKAQATFTEVKSAPPASRSITDHNYDIGKLTAKMNLASSGVATVKVTLPTGITMNGSTVTLSKGTISNLNVNKNIVTFNINGALGAVEFSFDKLLTPEGHRHATAAATLSLEDEIRVTQGGIEETKKSNAYSYLYPSLSIKDANANSASRKGDNQVEFKIFNGGNGKAYDIYFTITYPTPNVNYKKVEYNGHVLTPIKTQSSTYTFKIEKSKINGGNGLANNQSITIKETYTQQNTCLSSKNISYETNWGSGDTNDKWYQAHDNKANRTVFSANGSPNIEMTRKDPSKPNLGSNPENTDYTKSYFIRDKGLCGAVGSKLGTMRVSYTNYGTNNTNASAAYGLKIYLREGTNDDKPAFFRVENVRLVTASGSTALPSSSVRPTTTTFARTTGQYKAYEVDFSGFTSDPDGAGVGLEDLDGDGKYNDLPSGASYVIEYDLVKNFDVSNSCINKDYNGVLRHIYFNYLSYADACGNIKPLESNANELRTFQRYYAVSDASYMPASLYKDAGAEGVRFVVAGSTFHFIEYDNTGQNKAYSHLQYVIKIPTSIKIDRTSIKWFESNGYPATTPAKPIPASNIVYTTDASGTTIKIMAPTSGLGYVTMDMEANCTGPSTTAQVQYEALVIDKSDPQFCTYKLVCDTKNINIVCDSNCANDGPVILKTTAERAENSYGWTDHTMKVRHTKATMPESMKKRALYLDDIEITALGKQVRGVANNLYYSFTTNKGISLAPKTIVVKFTSGTFSGTTHTLNTATVTTIGSGANEQKKIVWNLTGALNGGSLQQNDTFEVVATYQVDKNSNDYATAKDIVAAEKSYFYMLQGGVEKYCGAPIVPEFYVANTFVQTYGLNAYSMSGCEIKSVAGNIIHWARRFNPSGTKFVDEFRPDRLVKTATFVLPSTYRVTKIEYDYKINNNDRNSRKVIEIPISEFTTSPDVTPNHTRYTFQNTIDPATGMYKMPPALITIHNEYTSLFRVYVQASCGSNIDKTTERVKTESYFYDYYYHYGKATSASQDGRIPGSLINNDPFTDEPMRLENKPSVSLQAVGNTSFSVTEKEQELKVSLTNTSAVSVAPYTWISIPEVSGVEVLGLWDGTTQVTRSATISGQYMYHLSTTGLAVGATKNYTIKVRLTNCANATLKVYAGWNCSEFSKGYDDNKTCSAANSTGFNNTMVTYHLQHSGSEIQLTRLKQPHQGTADAGKLKMCEENWYEYEINSSKPADVLQPTLSINKETGIEIRKVEVFYPFDATVPIKSYLQGQATDIGSAWQYELLPSGQVLKGTAATSDINQRKIKLRISIVPKCNVIAGTAFTVEIQGKNTCLGPLDGVRDASIPSAIVGVPTVNYSVVTKLNYVSGNANACSNGAIYKGEHTINISSGTTGNNGKIVIRVPKEYQLVDFTMGTKNGTFADSPGFENTNPPVMGVTREYKIPVPSGMSNLDSFTYSVTVKQLSNSPANCSGTEKLEYYAIDEVPPVTCPTGGCISSMTTVVGTTQNEDIKVQRSAITITDLKISSKPANATQEQLTFNFKVNTDAVAYTGNLALRVVYDQNNNGQIDNTDVVVGTISLTSLSIPTNGSVSRTTSLKVDADKVCRLLVAIDGNDNPCLCSINPIVAPTPEVIEDLVKDLVVCEGEAKTLEAFSNIPTYTAYHWTSTDTTAMTYLSADNVVTPTFKYIGTALTGVKTVTYALEITRQNGCKATQTITVVVKPSTSAPVATAKNYCGTKTIQDLINDIKLENATLPATAVYTIFDTVGSVLSPSTTLASGTYYVTTKVPNACDSAKRQVVVTVKDITTTPVTPTTATFCEGAATVATLKAKIANMVAGTLRVYTSATSSMVLSDTTVLSSTTYYYSAEETNKCESTRKAIAVTVQSNVISLSVPTTLVVDCKASIVSNTINNWLNQATVSDICGTATLTNNYTTIQPANLCNVDVVTVTFTGKDDKGNVVTKTSTIKVLKIDAVNDRTPAPINGVTGANGVIDVLNNDRVGNQSATTSNVTITVVTPATGSTPTPTLNETTGKIDVPAGTQSGTYTIVYRICTTEATVTVCDTATATIDVNTVLTPTPTVQATPDEFTYSGTGTQTVGNVLTNDTVSGTTSATTSNVTISQVSTPTGTIVPRIDTTNGNVIVPNNTPSGVYTLTYQICTVATPTACATATVEVTVPAVTPTPTVQATPDEFTYSGTGTQTVGNVLTNDTVSGTTSATTSNVTISQVSTPTGAIVPRIDTANGNVIVPNNTPSGIYTLTYQICTVATPTACATATVEVTVPAVTPTPTVQATPDEFTYSGTGTQTVGNVLTNDTVSGTTSATTSNVTISQVSTPTGAIVPRIDTTNGNVIVPNNTPSGIYTLTYQICTVATPTACATATVEVTVPAVTPTPTVEANPDTFTYTGTGTQTVGNVLTNDTVSGTTSATTSNVTISQVSTPTGSIVPRIDTTNGNVIVPNNTPSGIYTLTYQICTVATPTACATATVEVTVPAVTPTPTVQAIPDEFTYTGTGTQTVGNVLTNDTVSGTTSATTSNVTISQVSTPTGAIVPRIDTTNGNVIVPNNTPSGIYTLTYQICTVATPTACATATVEVTVPAATPTPTVEANPDTFTYTGTGTQTVGNVLTNDTVSGTTSATTSNVTISQVSTPTGTIVPGIDPATGNVIVPNNTPSGIYTITYQICTVATPTACATTTVEVTVPAATPTPTVQATPDEFTYSGTGTQTVGNVLTNDTVSGTTSATTSNVTISQVSTPTGAIVPSIDTTNGNVIVPNNTPSGIYTLTYQICTVATPTACATATVEVTVLAATPTPTVEATPDEFTYSGTGTQTVGNVLTNDTVSGTTSATTSNVIISQVSTPTGAIVPSIDTTNGNVIVPNNTPSGIYTLTYQICTVATPTACATATVEVTVSTTTTSTTPVLPVAADDRTTTPIDTPVVVNVLTNDTPNGATAPNVVTNPTNGTTVVNPDGTIEYRPHTGFVGIDTFVYELCNTDGCASATVTIEVVNKLVPYNGMSVDGDGKNEHFHIAGINRYPDNVVRIYNRWGVKVFETEGYDNVTRVFRGFSNGRVVVETSDKLPQGTYYYVIEYVDENKQKQSEVGWLYLKR
ncbi:hypothetical protein CGC53_09570 [Capnocytophaga leadbetteri]|uniref:Uncharacterized protein n=2 Tax=Capnocytophaga leadbetteri TaxID=327575 RepID=A0A250FBP6_9FLAO|nr:hypothetical protein CGC53_09570 [Capnocytophaga leadbetteri]